MEEDRRARRHNEALYAVEAKEAEHERRLRRLSADARRVLTADEISLFVDDPRPGVRTFAEGLKLRGAAMNKVVAADHRHQSAKEALASKQRQLVGELADSDPNAEVVGRSIARRLKGEVDAIVTVWLTIYQENGWEQPLSPAVIAGLLSDAVVAQATDDVLARRAAK